MNLNRAIDLYIGDLARRGRQKSTRNSYQRLLFDLADLMPRDCDTREIKLEDYETVPRPLGRPVAVDVGFQRLARQRLLDVPPRARLRRHGCCCTR